MKPLPYVVILVGPYASLCVLMSTYRFFCVLTGSNGVSGVVIGLYSFLRIPMGTYWSLWILWVLLCFYGF